ncbi:carboxypeptidase-like regulatory domain-containing protein [Rubinisphaera sp. JC750]|uniref:carboxypeptidase-like regulatory domain-containing protein n=1 Tax=Rubinisphaera sp. JC750 TaxID=2898658 RepID=UPI001F42A820|nr:carboxypeptidase-like regulatory domain-containing protein [Rubinisphaera sp. JC750]
MRSVLLGAVCLVLAGCGAAEDQWTANQKTTYPVQGVVMQEGAPVGGATVMFRSEGEQVAASGVTDDEGRFQLTTYDSNDGAVAGTHQVIVQKYDPKTLPENVDFDEVDEVPEPEMLTPKQYADFSTSDLTVEVTADGENEVTLELKP